MTMASDVVGYCDHFTLSVVKGWAVDRSDPTRTLTVEAWLEDEKVAEATTGARRADLPDAYRQAGFAVDLPARLRRRVGELRFLVAGQVAVQLPRARAISNYQAGSSGDSASDSAAKLRALGLPQDLAGLSFLDIGCNEGYFCDVALARGASRAVGLDASADYVARGRLRNPAVEFIQGSWDDSLPDGQFDVILLASALHYAADPAMLLSRLRERLSPDGLLILEAGVHPSSHAGMVTVLRSGDIRRFPTEPFLQDVLLRGYAVRAMGNSVVQQGDPIPRRVYHCRVDRPTALLIVAPSSGGKSILARKLQRRGMRTIEADVIMSSLANSQLLDEWPRVADLVLGRQVGGMTAAYEEVANNPDLLRFFTSEMSVTGAMRGEVDVYVVPEAGTLATELAAVLGRNGYLVWDVRLGSQIHPASFA
jgi:SAM-dependent methyltransferase